MSTYESFLLDKVRFAVRPARWDGGRVMKHLTECLPGCDGWPCRCPCHDDATEYHSVTCMAGGFDGFDCDHSGHVSAGQPANGGNMETPPEGASTPLRRLTATASTDSPGGHHG